MTGQSLASDVISIPPSSFWGGSDGTWSTFPVDVGSPPQRFNVLPSVGGSQLWLPDPNLACEGEGDLCPTLRGMGGLSISQNTSVPWTDNGIWKMQGEDYLYSDAETCRWYTTNASLTSSNGENQAKDQLLILYSDQRFWLGLMGLGDWATSLDSQGNGSSTSLLTTLKNGTQIGSLSYGYTAGAYYQTPPKPGSLTLGGYDKSQTRSAGAQININTRSQDLRVNIIQASTTNSLKGGEFSLLPENYTVASMRLDTATSQLWLPNYICDNLVEAFKLKEWRGFFFMTNLTKFVETAPLPTFSFTVGPGNNSQGATTIQFPWAAFNQTLTYPEISSGSYQYFPIKRATNDTQYVLGRTFFQEAYITVDWEANMFNISQADHSTGEAQLMSLSHQPPHSSSLSNGAIAGTTIACVTLAIAAAVSYWFMRRNKQMKQRKKSAATVAASTATPDEKWGMTDINMDLPVDRKDRFGSGGSEELDSSGVMEMDGRCREHELMSNEVVEMEGHPVAQEMHDGRPSIAGGEEKDAAKAKTVSVHEME